LFPLDSGGNAGSVGAGGKSGTSALLLNKPIVPECEFLFYRFIVILK